jgi:hypothetical protein
MSPPPPRRPIETTIAIARACADVARRDPVVQRLAAGESPPPPAARGGVDSSPGVIDEN